VTSPPPPPPPPSPPSPATTTYTVQSGDTLTKIAAKFGVTLAALEAANPQVTNPNLIYVGQVLVIPASAAAPAPPAPPPPAPPAPPAPAPTSSGLAVAGWMPYWSGNTGAADVKANVGKGLDECNAFWYSLEASGSLGLTGGARDATLVAAVHAAQRIIVPTVFDVGSTTNSKTVISSATLRATLTQNILSEIATYGYDGIDLDFESLGQANRADFSLWVQDLANQLHAQGKILSIAIWPKASEPGYAGAAALDYTALGAAVDRFKLMTYGDHGGFSGPGPIGSVGTGKTYVTYAIGKGVPPSRIFLGVPFYGYDWSSSGSKTALTWSQAQPLVAKATSGPTFEASQGETTFAYTDSAGATHTVWYQDEQAITAKEELAKSLGIGGVACWAIGGEGSDFFATLDKNR
jgi:spore germination protein YaaH